MKSPGACVALVRGASRGLGLALVEALLARPDTGRVFATPRHPDQSARLDALRSRHGARLVCERIVVATPRIHWLVNCAGVTAGRPNTALEAARGRRSEPTQAQLSSERRWAATRREALRLLLCHDEAAVLVNFSARIESIGDNRIGGWYGY